ncbi:DUF6240 domain-containing protein [Aneurinibacillus danicus]|uniref:Flagellar hook-length control protein-like C-terminal domain-containing protein n=2 Tax=Aneurinibacillus TaxID=55079 RepID=A0A511VB70_9BACL|nr:DUF6240 domain-containing protein [Aneurinibacillus danicus]GEN36186.1 hypothetical protein ADA01nite_36460 [Aneurinibacillus danicus]
MKVFDFLRNTGGMPTAGRNSDSRPSSAMEAVIKERVSANEAIVEIEGKKVKAVFENGVPAQSRVSVQVTAAKEDRIQVRVAQQTETDMDSTGKTGQNIERIMREAGVKATPEMREAVRILFDGKQPVTKETIKNVEQILQKGEGTVQQKLDALQIMMKKNIHVTVKSFEAVFRTLHGPTLDQLVERMADELPELAGKPTGGEKTTARANHQAARVEMMEKNAQPEKPEVRLARQLATLRDAVVQAEKQKGTIDKEQLQKLIREMENTLEAAKESSAISKETGQRVERLTRQMQNLTQSAVGQSKMSVDQVTRVADRLELNRLIKTIAMEVKDRTEASVSLPNSRAEDVDKAVRENARQEARRVQPQVNRETAGREGSHTLARQLDTMVKVISGRQPVNREALQQLVQQVKFHPELAQVNSGAREQIQKAVQQIEQAVHETPQTEKVVSADRLARLVDRANLEQAAKLAARETSLAPSIVVPGSGRGEKAIRMEGANGHHVPRLSQKIEVLAKAVSSGQPINKEALRQLVEQIGRSPEFTRLSTETREQLEKAVKQIEQAVRTTPSNEKIVSSQRLDRFVDRANLEQVSKQASRELNSAQVKQETLSPSSTIAKGNAPTESIIQSREKQAGIGGSQQLSEKLETLVKAIASGGQLDKKLLEQFVRQIKESLELKSMSVQTRQAVQQAVASLEQVMRQVPSSQPSVSGRVLAERGSLRLLEQATKSVSQEIKLNTSSESNRPAERLAQKLEVLAKAASSGQPINKEALRQLVEQIKQSPDLAQLSAVTREQIQKVVNQVEQTVYKIRTNEREVSAEQVIKNISAQRDAVPVEPKGHLSPEVKPQVAELEKEEVPSEKSALRKVQREVAERVLVIRTEGRVTRQQIEGLQQAVQNLIREAGGSVALQQDTRRFMEQISKDLRMSMSYEAVGRSAEGKIIVQRTADQLIQAFKLPVVETAKGEAVQRQADALQSSSPVVLKTMAQTYERLSGIVAAARAEIQSSSGVTASALLHGKELSGSSFGLETGRMPQQILQDVQWLLETTIETEGLPKEMVQKLHPLLSALEEAAVSQASFATGEIDALFEQDAAQRIQVDADAALTQIHRLFEEEAGRLAAYANVQAANFELISHYIPEHLRQVAEEFMQTKKEILSNVERMSQFLRQEIPQASSYIKQVIEPTIEMVNRLVSKGEFALFADMEFEHSVLKISGQLQDIKSMLDKGQTEQALRSFQAIRSELEKLNWQPSYMKVERFFSKKAGEGRLQNPLELYGREWKNNELTGRGVQEWMRGMGLGYEREAIEWMSRRAGENREMGTGVWNGNSLNLGQGSSLTSGGVPSGHKTEAFPSFTQSGQQSFQSQDERPQNMKSMIMDQLENGNLSPRAREVLEQTLSNVTGQQLLSKHEPGAPVQTMYFQLPLPWEEGMQNVQMHIHSRNNGEQMDWENCSLFFFLSTPRFGDTGIGVTVVERDMTLRIQNNHPQVERAFEPYIPQLKEQLQGLGYRIQGISFAPMNEPIQEKKPSALPLVDVEKARAKAASMMVREGVDLSI